MSLYYDRNGKPIDADTRHSLYEDRKYQVVAFTELPGATISTVWLGLDHSWGQGPPVIFETMVFGGALDQEQERYSTEAEAVAGHAAMVERVKAAEVEAAASARLVATAPKLAETLATLLKLHDAEVFIREPWDEAFETARAVLAEAAP